MGRRERRKDKNKQVIMTWVLILLMVMSIAGIIIGSTAPAGSIDLNYGKFKFGIVNNYYTVKIDNMERRFFFHPIDTISLDVPSAAVTSLRNTAVIAVTFDPNSTELQAIEVSRYQLGNNLDTIIYSAVTTNNTVYDYDIVLCEDANPGYPVLFFNASNETSITYDNGCITINGNGNDLIKGTERLIYSMLGVIE